MKSEIANQKHLFWQEHIEKWEASGLSQLSYCEAYGLKQATFGYYRHRVLKLKTTAPSSVNFVAIETKPMNLFSSNSVLQLMLPNGIRLGVSSDVSESLLKMVLKAAGEV